MLGRNRFPMIELRRPTAYDVLKAPVTVLVGHFGAGKTEIAVNLAFGLRERRADVTLVDLDLVKPYFRSRLAHDDLVARGIDLVTPTSEYFQADLPIVVPGVRAAVAEAAAGRRRVVVDVGGADVGARVLGSIPGFNDPDTADILFVVNGNRPFAETPAAVIAMLREVETSAKLKVNGLVANTHLIDETTTEIVREGIELATEVGRATGLPVRFCAVLGRLAGLSIDQVAGEVPVLPIDRYITPPIELRRPGSRRRSSVV
jgi:hypothetical protein